MADFVAVLRKTIDGLGDTAPAMRQKVYEKARATVTAKLAAINPPPPAAVIERQKKSLEDAIATIEADYVAKSGPEIDPLEQLENVFATLDGSKPAIVTPAKAPPPPAPAPKPMVEEQPFLAGKKAPAARAEPDFGIGRKDGSGDEFDEPAQPRRRGLGRLIAAVIALAVIGGGGYAAWLNKDEFSALLGLNQPADVAVAPTPAETPPAEAPGDTATAQPDDPAQPPAATAPAEAAPAPEQPPKFTQRLNADGTEVDEGPAGGEQTVGEGTSVAAVTQPPAAAPATPADPNAAPAEPGTPAEPAPGAAQPALPVGQKAIFYEERTNVAQGSADTGAIVWSLVQESPGGDLPPEPAIRAEATIPGKDLQLRMTIRRNGDRTLPASHIVELIFLTPEGFEGGGIENILRVTLKDSEQAAGNPLLGIPAKIADGFFLLALSDTKAEMDTNLALLRRESWIDVPILYKSGRRALITMEKGVPGDKVFDEALRAWQANSAG